MTTVISNWGGPGDNLSWLDGFSGCTAKCNGNPTVSFSHLNYESKGHVKPSPSPTPSPSPS